MEKDRFSFLSTHSSSLTGEEATELAAAQSEYPYCQPIRVLLARSGQTGLNPQSQQWLHQAAVYATDRSVLKAILTAPVTNEEDVEEEETDNRSGTAPAETRYELNPHLAQEVMSDLIRLQQLRQAFEVSVEEYRRGVPSVSPASSNASPTTEPRNQITQTQSKVAVESPVEVELLEQEPPSEALLEEIKIKKKFKPESPRQKEQIDIIDQFIKKQPSISKITAPPADTPDLAEKSISLTDNIVSETLVEILLRQGKKEKAIEVLKKLIWKFPQKKSIFAAQIEELRK